MDQKERLMHLGVPLYKLYYLDSLEGFVFRADEADGAIDHYGTTRVEQMVQALDWALHAPPEEWAEALPDTSHAPADVRHYIQTTADALRAALTRH